MNKEKYFNFSFKIVKLLQEINLEYINNKLIKTS